MVTAMSKRVAEGGGRRREEERERGSSLRDGYGKEDVAGCRMRQMMSPGRQGGCEGILPFNM